jgi:hypothetical protein
VTSIERKTPSKNILEFLQHFSSRSHHKLFFGPPCMSFKKILYEYVCILYIIISALWLNKLIFISLIVHFLFIFGWFTSWILSLLFNPRECDRFFSLLTNSFFSQENIFGNHPSYINLLPLPWLTSLGLQK